MIIIYGIIILIINSFNIFTHYYNFNDDYDDGDVHDDIHDCII